MLYFSSKAEKTMAKPVNTIKTINGSQMLWKISVRVIDKWSVINQQMQEHLEMVFVDAEVSFQI